MSTRVLELRIHGVNNTAPWAMLDVAQDAARQVEGDTLGSFWQPTADGQAALRPDDPGRVPDGIVREAYSWGGMARSSVAGVPTGAGKYVSAAARVGWTLLLPFSLLNMAYWSRRLMTEERDDSGAARRVHRDGWRQAGGGAQLRVAGLLMTLLLTLTLSIVFLDLVSVQCYQDPNAPCANLPSFVDFLSGWDAARRLALMSLAPLVAMLLLYWLTLASATRYTASTSTARAWQSGHAADASDALPVWPMLRTRGFWNPVKLLQRTALLHFTAVGALIVLITSWSTTYGDGAGCNRPAQLLHSACWHQVDRGGARSWTEFAVVVVALLVLGALALVVAVGTEDAPDVHRPSAHEPDADAAPRKDWTMALAGVAAGMFAAQELILALWPAPRHDVDTKHPMLGIAAMPAVVVTLVLAVAVAGSSWRLVESRMPLRIALVFAVALLLSSFSWRHGDVAWVFRGIALLALVWSARMVLTVQGGARSEQRRYTAWGGCAPGVFIMLALLFAMVLASGVVVAVGNALNGSNSAAALVGAPPKDVLTGSAATLTSQTACAAHHDCPADLQVPRPYVWFGAALLPLGVLFVLVLLVVVVTSRRGPPDPILPEHDLADYPGVHGSVESHRWQASLAHRAEKYAGVLALLGFLAITGALTVSISGWRPRASTGVDAFADWALGTGMWVLAFTGLSVIGLAAGGKAVGNARPLGLLWDLTCFLPKAAHPFAPPCYAERVIPELLSRYEEWLTVDGEAPAPGVAPPGRHIVLSAHSLGSVLAVASVFALLPEPTDDDTGATEVAAISLLTYGSQLRAYFGRIMPELLGPDVLGHLPSRGANLFGRDAWATSLADEDARPDAPPADSLRALLGGGPGASGRWISLWHRTDYIGFPVVRYTGSPVDRYAQEVDASGYMLKVLTHGDYPRTPAYAKALADLSRPG